MIIISSSQDLEDNPNLVIIDCINHLVIFSCQPTGKIPALVKASHHPSKAFLMCSSHLHLWKKISTVQEGALHNACKFEGGNLLNLNLTPVTNTPATSRVVWLSHRAIFANISQIFLRELCAFVCAQHNMHSMCTHKRVICYSIVSAWS